MGHLVAAGIGFINKAVSRVAKVGIELCEPLGHLCARIYLGAHAASFERLCGLDADGLTAADAEENAVVGHRLVGAEISPCRKAVTPTGNMEQQQAGLNGTGRHSLGFKRLGVVSALFTLEGRIFEHLTHCKARGEAAVVIGMRIMVH